MALNDLCEKDPYELKTIREVINATQGHRYFTVLDLKEGFYTIEIEEEDKGKTAFEFDGRVYEWNSMVMGLKNSLRILQRMITKILENELRCGVSVYMDDIVVCGRTRVEHDEVLRRVLQKLCNNNLKINENKLQFALSEVTWC
ncbi:MAG: reverse transcriptase family protein [Aeromonas sp.]